MAAANAATTRPRILVIRNRFIGDTVLAIPFLRNLRQNFPDATIDVLVEPVSGDVLAACPYVDELLRWTRPRTQRRSLLQSVTTLRDTARWLADRHYDRSYVLKRAAVGGLLTRLAGIPHRVGFACQGQSLFLSRASRLRPLTHEVEHFLDVLRCDGLTVDDGHNENWIDPEAAAQLEQRVRTIPTDRPWIFLAPSASGLGRRWPAERFAAVIDRIHAATSAVFFLCGGPGDVAMHAAIRDHAGHAADHLHDVTAESSLPEAAALIARCALCIGVDTGLVHIAASFGKPCVVIFGAADPHQWHPWGTSFVILRSPNPKQSFGQRLSSPIRQPSTAQRWPSGRADPLDVSVDDVVTASLQMLTE
jgi:heptosyltransferase-2